MKIDQRLFWRGLAAVALGLFLTSVQAKPPFGEGWNNRDESTGKRLAKHGKSKDEGWVRHDSSNVELTNVPGMDGKLHSATCSGYPGTNPAFSFWSKKGKSKDLAVFFEGGGACWDNVTCTFPIDKGVAQLNQDLGLPPQSEIPQFFVPAIDADTNPADYDGIFNSSDPKNPIKDWTIVYIPYCTGDLHTGSTAKNYYNARGAVLLPDIAGLLPDLPSAPTPITIQHRGFDNFMVVLDWMKKNVDDPKNVLVTGASAGGYGATANFPWVERLYGKARTHVIADASQGVTTPAFDQFGRSSWNMQLDPSVFGSNPSLISGPELLRVAASARPDVKTAQFTTAYDGTQISFYGYMARFYNQLGFYAGGGTCSNLAIGGGVIVPGVAIDWNHQMITSLLSYADELPNFRYYLATGSYHTLLRSPLFYTEESAGITVSKWVQKMLAGGKHASGPGSWRNADSAASRAQLPCVPAAPS